MNILQLQEAEQKANPDADVFEALARKLKPKSSRAYLSQLAYGHRKPSPEFCRKLVVIEPRLTLEALRPDVYGPTKPAKAAAAA